MVMKRQKQKRMIESGDGEPSRPRLGSSYYDSDSALQYCQSIQGAGCCLHSNRKPRVVWKTCRNRNVSDGDVSRTTTTVADRLGQSGWAQLSSRANRSNAALRRGEKEFSVQTGELLRPKRKRLGAGVNSTRQRKRQERKPRGQYYRKYSIDSANTRVNQCAL